MPIIEIKGVSKYFNTAKGRHKVLDGLNLEVLDGEILCILGPSGSGKSTLLRQVAGFDVRDAGQIRMHGREIRKPQVSRMMIFQDFNQLFPWKTVMENIIYPLKVNAIGQSQEQRKQIALKYLKMVELEGFEHYYPHQLSGGMKQKAALARALAVEPEVLLMDEPFGSLDALTRISLQETLLKVWEEKRLTILFVTHDIQEAIILADRIAIMGDNGKMKDIVGINLTRPRVHGQESFVRLYRQIYSLLNLNPLTMS